MMMQSRSAECKALFIESGVELSAVNALIVSYPQRGIAITVSK